MEDKIVQKKNITPKIFNIDFDFTCVIPDYKTGGIDIGAVPVLKRMVANGHKLILFTCRSNMPYTVSDGYVDVNGLDDAINWFRKNDIPLYGIQINPEQYKITTSKKSLADYTIDDTALGTPLINDREKSNRPFVNWVIIEMMLENMNLI
jgi:hypothetical protein